MNDTVFLDRDGVINRDSSAYIKTPAEFVFLPKSCEAISLLSQNGFKIVLITNQSAIARGMASRKTLQAIFDKMIAGVKKAGGSIDDIFFCPHHPKDHCECRKPKPKMILDAAKKHGIDLSSAVMVGDSTKDIVCGLNAGCAKTVLVNTGNGKKAGIELKEKGIEPDAVCTDLFEAARWIIENR